MGEFGGKVAVVTGGGTGIGLGAARRLAQGGAGVVLCGHEEGPLAEAEAALAEEGLTAAGKVADVASMEACRDAVAFAVERFGGVDILVNSAAIQPYGTVETMEEAEWERVMSVNLTGAYRMAHFAIPEMRRRGGGAIVNIASVQGLACQTNVAAYAASKGGMLALTRAMAQDHAADNIRVNAVCPGSIDTPMLRYAASENKGEGTQDEIIAVWGRMHPIGRVGRIEEVAELIAFLAGPRSSFCTGGEYKVDGGLMAKIGVVLPE